MAALRHRPGLLDDPAVVHAITSSAALALAHERLATDARGRLAQLQASRRRIVAAADAERRRVEHDLHDGAQQRLVSLAVALRAAAANGDDGGNLDAARAELGEALAELRTIARGLYPAVLTEMGLAAALEALAETAPLPLKLSALPEARLEPGVEAAAYFAVSELLLDPAAAHVTVTGRHGDGALRLTLTTDAPGCELTRIADRVGASGGSVRRRRANGAVELDMEIPCAS
jgi:signal transduction histidine kinase